MYFNDGIITSKFPSLLNYANTTHIFDKEWSNIKEKYIPVSILPTATIKNLLNLCVDLEKNLTLNTAY